jgi:hypothetical protein
MILSHKQCVHVILSHIKCSQTMGLRHNCCEYAVNGPFQIVPVAWYAVMMENVELWRLVKVETENHSQL